MLSSIQSTQPLDEPFNLPPVSVHRIELPKEYNYIYREDTNRKIETGIILFLKGIAQESKAEKVKHQIKTIHGFRMRIFYSRKPGKSLIGKQLEDLNRDKIFERASTDYLIFLIRVSSKADHDLYAATTGNMFNIIAPYVDYGFSRCVAKRFVSPDLSQMNIRHLTGPLLKSSLIFCRRPNFSSVELQTRFITDFVASFKSSSSVYCLIHPHTEPKPVNVEVKMKSVRINVELELDVFTSILNHFSKIYHKIPTFQCVHFSERTKQIVEEDDPDFFFLDLITRAPYELSRVLDRALLKRLWKLYSKPSDMTGLRFWHRYADDFLRSGTFALFYKTNEICSWTAPPTIVEVLNKLQPYSSDEEKFIGELPNVMFGFNRNGEFFKESLIKFFEAEITLPDGRVFFRNHGLWLQVSAEYLVLVENDFLEHLSACLMRKTDPGQLPKPWISQKMWATVKWSELEALLDTRNQTVIAKLWEDLSPILEIFSQNERKRKRCSQTNGQNKRQKTLTSEKSLISYFGSSSGSSSPIPDQNECFLVKKDPSPLTDLPEALQALLCKKHGEYQGIKREGEYNESYVGEASFLVGDRITPHGVELFDLLQVVEETLCLYQVKESFSETTTKACSQIQNAAQALSSALHSPFSASTILDKFWHKAVDGEKNDSYFKKLKKSYEDFGKSNFLNLFKRDRKKICFVLALLDDAVSERLLEDELDRSLVFRESDFNGLDKTISGSQIIKALKDCGYMAENGQISSNIYKKSHTKFFLGERFSSHLTSIIFHKIFGKLTRFSSTMAKVDIGQTRKLVEDLGFTFKICQISRLGDLPTSDLDSTEDDQSIWDSCVDSSTQPLVSASSSFSSNDSFSFQDNTFMIIETPGDGSCGLHALGGSVENDVCSFPEENPKEAFVVLIQDNLDDSEVKQQIQLCLVDLLEIALSSIRTHEADQVFSETHLSLFKSEYQRAEQELNQRLERLMIAEGKAWIELLKKAAQFKLRSEILAEKFPSRNKHFGTFIEGDEKLVVTAIDNRRDEIMRRKAEYNLNDADLVLINQYRQERIDNQQLTAMKEAFVLKQEIMDHYFQCLQGPGYYLSTQELKLAAYLYRRNMTIFKVGENDVEIAEQYKCGEDSEEVFIFHHFPHSQHFSRCDKQIIED